MDGPESENSFGDDQDLALFARVAEILQNHRSAKESAESERLLKSAREDLENYYSAHPTSVAALRLLSECAQRLDDIDAARIYIAKAELLDPWDLEILIISESLYELSASLQEHHRGKPPRLSSEINSGVVNPDVLLERAMGSFRLGDLERAYTLAKLSYRINPKYSHILMDVLAVGSSLDPKRTYQEFLMLEQEDDPPAYLYLALGSVLNVMGLYLEAISWLSKGISVESHDPYVLGMLYNELAYVMAKQGLHVEKCILLARKALELFPNDQTNGFIRDTLGIAYLKNGNVDKAIQYLQEAVSKDPSAIPRFHLALALLHNKDVAGALHHLEVIANSRPSLESPHVEETAILERVQSHIARLKDLLNLGGADDIKDALQILDRLI